MDGKLTKRGISILSDLPERFLRDPINLLAFGFGSGCAPKAPGTFGTLVGLVIYLLLADLSLWLYLSVVLVSAVLGIWICAYASEKLGVHDHGGIVWDEMVGYWITMIAAPDGWLWVLWGFVLFRLFDIWKPQPIRFVDERVHGGLGIMMDDVLAGIYALLGLQLSYLLVMGMI